RPDCDGVFVGVALVAANLFGLGFAATQVAGEHSVAAARVADAPPTDDSPDARPAPEAAAD
ncbi:hypothetical protein GL263_22740, partial [Streptomyces durbertensis]